MIYNREITFSPESETTMYLSKNTLFILLYWVSMIAMTSADYCEWGYCSLSEYCCGDNHCCTDNKTTWILVGVLLTALVVASVCCACFYRHIDYYGIRMRWPFSSNEPLIPQTKSSFIIVISPSSNLTTFSKETQ